MNDLPRERIELEEKLRKGAGLVDDYFKLGKLYLQAGQYTDLLALYQRLEEKSLSETELARLYYERGEALESSNRDEAISSYTESLRHINPRDDFEESLFLKGVCHYNLLLLLTDSDERHNNGNEAVKAFETIFQKYPTFRDRYALFSYIADTYSKLNQYQEALSFYKAALKISSNDIERIGALTGIGVVLGQQKKVKKATEYFDKALQEAAGTFPISKINYEKGKMLFDSNDFKTANDAFKLALDNIEDDPSLKGNQEYRIEILWHLGTIAYELKEDQTATSYLSKILDEVDESHRYYANANLTLGHIYLFRDNFVGALEHYNRVLTAPHAFEQERAMAKRGIGQIPLDS